MQLKKFKFHVQCGEYSGGWSSATGGKGTWSSSSSQSFDVIIESQYSTHAEKIALAQYGGPARCKVSYRGEVK
jgi:hypothetical protein